MALLAFVFEDFAGVFAGAVALAFEAGALIDPRSEVAMVAAAKAKNTVKNAPWEPTKVVMAEAMAATTKLITSLPKRLIIFLSLFGAKHSAEFYH